MLKVDFHSSPNKEAYFAEADVHLKPRDVDGIYLFEAYQDYFQFFIYMIRVCTVEK